jgi:hexokinase
MDTYLVAAILVSPRGVLLRQPRSKLARDLGGQAAQVLVVVLREDRTVEHLKRSNSRTSKKIAQSNIKNGRTSTYQRDITVEHLKRSNSQTSKMVEHLPIKGI